MPALNGHWRDDGFVPGAEVNPGIAVSLRQGGLLAPVIHHADTLSPQDLMARLKDLVQRARRGRLRGSETSGATLTVTSLGEHGVEAVFGVIHPPQVALVGFGAVVERLTVRGGRGAGAGPLSVRCVSLSVMELTQTAVDELLARIGPYGGHMYLPGDLDVHELTDLLGSRYGAPRTLVLDGFTDPTVDESRGADLLVPFLDRAVTIRAWAYADQWIATGTARDAEGAERPVLAVAHREVPRPLAVFPGEDGEDVDWLERLKGITGWTRSDQRPDVDWAALESRLGTALPADYKRMVETFGVGAFDGYLDLNQEPWTELREDGLLIWAGTEAEDVYCWRTDGDDPGRWPVVVRSFDNTRDLAFGPGTARFVCHALVDPLHPYSLARYFDTHWFMTYGVS
ncbi:2-oxo acid dehydrogenase subunit E2 [Streptomyces sp. NPDC101169]|uniref:2-oxo acid dehydrogenase subunit E2 n=1 Tax=Streptomyces sp. NPDC101169 TaxID=3366121 RepID=UPI00380FFFAF